MTVGIGVFICICLLLGLSFTSNSKKYPWLPWLFMLLLMTFPSSFFSELCDNQISINRFGRFLIKFLGMTIGAFLCGYSFFSYFRQKKNFSPASPVERTKVGRRKRMNKIFLKSCLIFLTGLIVVLFTGVFVRCL